MMGGGWLFVLVISSIPFFCFASTECEDNKMPYVLLGNTGLLVSKLSYGAWITFGSQLDVDGAYQLMKFCYDHGINYFDNAETYNDGVAEVYMGKALKKMEQEDSIERSHLIISTKIFWGDRDQWRPNSVGLSRKRIVEGLRASLKRLQLDYVDLVFAHRFDPHTPMEEIVRGFDHVINQGLAFYWCTSEWPASRIIEAIGIADRLGLHRPQCEQPQYNLFHRKRFEVEYEDLFQQYKYGTTTWSALSSGLLTGKYASGKIPDNSRLSLKQANYILEQFKSGERHDSHLKWEELIDKVQQLGKLAAEIDCSMAQLALAWVLKNENVSSLILGGTSIKQLSENLESLTCMAKLNEAIMSRIDDITGNKPTRAKDWNPLPKKHQFIS